MTTENITSHQSPVLVPASSHWAGWAGRAGAAPGATLVQRSSEVKPHYVLFHLSYFLEEMKKIDRLITITYISELQISEEITAGIQEALRNCQWIVYISKSNLF